jgi:nudix-type nucleoside diphosphatase (YffH/AdpP family)
MGAIFLAGALADAEVRRQVFGDLAAVPARLPGHVLAGPGIWPLPVPGAGAVEGWLLTGVGADARSRVVALSAVLGGQVALATIEVAGAAATATTLLAPDPAAPLPDDWRARWLPVLRAALPNLLARLTDGVAPERLARRLPQILTQAGARVRAAEVRPTTFAFRHRPAPGDVTVLRQSEPYADYFSVEARDLRHRRFDGAQSPVMDRAVFMSGDAAILLPYDPVRDLVLLIEQFRAGPQARGDAAPWLIEAVAGRIDGGETPEEAARREAREEAGIEVTDLIPGPRYYPTPAAKSEYLYSFVALCDLSERPTGGGGLPSEAEDIRSHIIPFAQLLDMVETGEVDNAPLLILTLWLAPRRTALGVGAGA